jgi:hypothetical protein
VIRAALVLAAMALLVGCTDDTEPASTSVTTTSAASATAPSTTPQPPTTPPTSVESQPLPGGSLEVLVVGDSVMFDAEAGIAAALTATGAATVRNGAVFGLGFSDEAGIPFAGAADDLLTGEPVEQVVVMIGSWDHIAAQRDPDAYADQVAAGLDRLAADGRSLLVLGEPPSRPDKGEETVRAVVNQTLEAAVAEAPGARFVSTDTVIGDARGRFLMTGPDGLLRKPDGRHLCPAGATRFGTAVLTELQLVWELPDVDPVWALGPWRDDPRYDDPAGACPDA